jgi:hypothetical protein
MNISLAILAALFAQLWPNPGPGRAAPGGGGASDTAYVASFTGGTTFTTFTGCVGHYFKASDTTHSITKLRRWVSPGNSQTHTLYLVDADAPSLLGSCSVNTAGQSGWVECTPSGAPIAITSTTANYAVSSSETSGGDSWLLTASITPTVGAPFTTTVGATATAVGGCASGYSVNEPGTNISHVPVDFRYQ